MKIKLALVSIVLLIVFSSCLTMRKSDKAYMKMINKSAKSFTIERDTISNTSIRYIRYKNPDSSLPTLFFIHGAPGSSSAFSDYIQSDILRKKYSIISIDRPGYGYTTYGKFTTIANQVEIISGLINKLDIQNKVYIVGHSYGATLSGILAIDPPSSVVGCIMLAPAIDPDNEKIFWFTYLGKWKLTRWLTPIPLKVATDEKMSHADELKVYIPRWSHVKVPILHVHGDKDNIVPFVNQIFSEKNIDTTFLTKIILKREGHIFPYRKVDMTIKLIDDYIESLNK